MLCCPRVAKNMNPCLDLGTNTHEQQKIIINCLNKWLMNKQTQNEASGVNAAGLVLFCIFVFCEDDTMLQTVCEPDREKAWWHMGSNSLCQLRGRDTDSLSLWDHPTHGGTRLVLRRTCWCKWGLWGGGVKRTNCALTVPDGVYQLKRTYGHLSHVKGPTGSLLWSLRI